MTHIEKDVSVRQVTLTHEERSYLLKAMELDIEYTALLINHPKTSQKSRDHHLFLRALQEKLSS